MKFQPRYQPGDEIGGRYEVYDVKMGGMGEVYLCLDLENAQPFALKTFHQRYLTNRKLRQAFENEVVIWIALENHPNIVRCFFMDNVDNQPFMFLQWIAGEEDRGTNLRSWLHDGPIDLHKALDFTIDICRGLAYAQEKQPGLVHRDLKPENILIAQGPIAKITDFGLAQIVQQVGLEIDRTQNETQEWRSTLGWNGVAGTPAYMAPEQWQGEILDVRTDIYAIGCILYEMLTGDIPFQATTFDDLRRQHLVANVPKLTDKQHLSDEINILLNGCLAKRKEERFSTVSKLLEEIDRIYYQQFGTVPKRTQLSNDFRVQDYINRATTYHRIGKFSQALDDHNRAIELAPELALVYNNRGLTYRNLKLYPNALSDVDYAIRLDPTIPQFYTNRGLTLHDIERYSDALTDYNQAAQLDPNDFRIYSNRGLCYHKMGLYEKALSDFDKAIKLNNSEPYNYFNRSITYHELHRYDETITDLDRAIGLNPAFAKAYRNRGNVYFKLEQNDKALHNFNWAIELESTDPTSYVMRGLTHRRLEYHNEALLDFNHAILLNPTDATTYFIRGKTYEKLQLFDEAVVDYDQAVLLDPEYIEVYLERGNLYEKLQRYDLAIADMSRIIQLDPKHSKAYYNRGTVYSKLQQYEEALSDFDWAAQLDPTYGGVYANRGLVYENLQRYDEALADYGQAIKLDPDDIPPHLNRGRTYSILQRFNEALADFGRVIELDPNVAAAYFGVGLVLTVFGELVGALDYFERADQLGHPEVETYASKTRQMLSHALTAFLNTNSLAEIYEVVNRFPFFKTDIDFIPKLVMTFFPESQLAFKKRFAWLRQIVNEQNQ